MKEFILIWIDSDKEIRTKEFDEFLEAENYREFHKSYMINATIYIKVV